MKRSRAFIGIIYCIAGILAMSALSFFQKLIIGGVEVALQPRGFIVPVLAGCLLGCLLHYIFITSEQKYLLERKNRELAEWNSDEISRLNEDLQTYDYSINNALQTPVRQLIGYYALLEEAEENEDSVSLSKPELRERIRTKLEQLNELLDSLRTLSRVSRSELQFADVNLSTLVAGLLKDHKHENDDIATEFNIQADVICHGDPALLYLAMGQLVENAVVFSLPKGAITISFGTRRTNGIDHCFLADRGVGIEEERLSNIFVPFHSFHTANSFDGTGIGLAIVKRVVERHGGRIWIESVAGEGTTVNFTMIKQ